MTPPDWNSRKLHFIGIGGAGMSGLALVAVRLGADVSGSDRNESSYLERVRRSGATVVLGHDADNLPSGADVVISTAIAGDNPELAAAREGGHRVSTLDLLSESGETDTPSPAPTARRPPPAC
jgi:UDP-N-acetylmuramate--alanine ligase